MAAFATVSDLVARWRPLEGAEAVTASALLEDAAVEIRAARPGIDVEIEAGELDPAAPMIVSCRMVKRSMSGPAGFEGVSQWSPTSGPHSQSLTFANPTGDMYLTKADKKLLGIRAQKAFSIDMAPDASWVGTASASSPYGDDGSWYWSSGFGGA